MAIAPEAEWPTLPEMSLPHPDGLGLEAALARFPDGIRKPGQHHDA
ncbi:hypothetical protein ACFU8W_50690 [Streptomyces sp. NPDC057565]